MLLPSSSGLTRLCSEYPVGNSEARSGYDFSESGRQLDDGNQRRIHVEGYQGPAKVIRLTLPWHGGLRRSVYIRADGYNPRRSPLRICTEAELTLRLEYWTRLSVKLFSSSMDYPRADSSI
jgi:hypothetical protein